MFQWLLPGIGFLCNSVFYALEWYCEAVLNKKKWNPVQMASTCLQSILPQCHLVGGFRGLLEVIQGHSQSGFLWYPVPFGAEICCRSPR